MYCPSRAERVKIVFWFLIFQNDDDESHISQSSQTFLGFIDGLHTRVRGFFVGPFEIYVCKNFQLQNFGQCGDDDLCGSFAVRGQFSPFDFSLCVLLDGPDISSNHSQCANTVMEWKIQ